MPNAQPEQATGRDDSEFPTPEPVASQAAAPGQPTLQEFLTRLVGNPETRSAFDADPRGTLDNAGLGDLNAAQVLHASSLMLDYAPADVVTEYGRTAQPSIDTFTASTQHVAINQLEPGQNNEQQEATETMSADNSPAANFSSEGDIDKAMEQNQQGQETSIDVDSSVENQDSNNLLNVHDVASGNDVANNTVDTAGDTVDNTVDTAGDTVNNTVDGALGTVNSTVDTAGDVAVGAGGAALGTVNNTLDDTTSTVDTAATNVTDGSTLEGATGAVGGTLEGATGTVGGVVNEAEGVVGGATSDLPLDLL